MEIKHTDLITDINTSNPFAKCKLGRESIANALTNVISSYPNGFVLAINNEWGTGKTTFVRMWQQLLENNQFKTIYFNAWENDFDQNPLVAIISELKELSDPSSKSFFEAIIPKAATIAKSVVPAVVKAVLKQCGIGDVIGAVAEGVTDVFEKEVDDYKAKKQTITEFRKELEAFVSKTKGDKPLVFFIDELDRCRPDYAVELLEQIKHLFSVRGVVFVLSIDKEQLGHAIRGFYGSDRINAEEYLRRFIDLEYSMQPPTAKIFCNYLYDYYGFADVFETSERRGRSEFQSDKELFQEISAILLEGMTLRQQEKIYGFTRLVISSFNPNAFIFPNLLLVLVYIKMMMPELYDKIRTHNLSIQELINEFEKLIPEKLYSDMPAHGLLFLEARLLTFYRNSNDHYRQQEKLYEMSGETNKFTTYLQTKLRPEDVDLAEALSLIRRDSHTGNAKLSYLLDKIDLLYNTL